MKFADRISPIMQELENAFLDVAEVKQDFDLPTFRASAFIFQSVIMDKLFDKILREKTSQQDGERLAFEVGSKLRNLIMEYTGIDSFDLYK